MTNIKKLTISSAAKINLYLNVSKTLRPDGYHEIKSIMQSVSLSDELYFEVSPKSGHQKNPDNGNGIAISCNNMEIPLNEKNLVHKAALLMFKNFGLKTKYRIKIGINKSIPIGAGLAGGSTNAAATIVAINKIFNLKLSDNDMKKLGSEVGSDVPFCISGGTALVEGKGEKICKLPDLPFYWVIIAINGKKFLSGDVYDRFDLIGTEEKSSHKDLVGDLINKDYNNFFACLSNDLERVVIQEDKMIVTLKENAIKLGAFSSQMTGSGPAIFAFCQDLKVAGKVFEGMQKITERVFLSYTTPFSQDLQN